MNSKTNTRIKRDAADYAVPQSLEDAAAAVAEIGRCQRERDRIQAEMNDGLAAVRTEYETLAKPHAARIAELTQGTQVYFEAHRDALTKDGKTKTVRLATGEVSWRMRPPSVNVRGGELVIAMLQKLGLDRLLRVKTEVDKTAVLREPDVIAGVKGLSISQREEFVIKPDSTALEEVR